MLHLSFQLKLYAIELVDTTRDDKDCQCLLLFAYCEASDIFTEPTHFSPVMA